MASLRLREAIRIAEEAHCRDGNRYYVMPQHGSSGKKLIIMDRRNFRRLKMKHYIGRDARVFDMLRECFYFTGNRADDQRLPPDDRKRKILQYFAWVDADRKQSKRQ